MRSIVCVCVDEWREEQQGTSERAKNNNVRIKVPPKRVIAGCTGHTSHIKGSRERAVALL